MNLTPFFCVAADDRAQRRLGEQSERYREAADRFRLSIEARRGRRLPPPVTRAHAGLPSGARLAGDLVGAARGGGTQLGRRLRRARTAQLSRMRDSRPRLRSRTLSRVCGGLCDRVLVQRPRRMPVVHHQAHGGDCCASRGGRDPTSADAAVGVVATQAAAAGACAAIQPWRPACCGCSSMPSSDFFARAPQPRPPVASAQ